VDGVFPELTFREHGVPASIHVDAGWFSLRAFVMLRSFIVLLFTTTALGCNAAGDSDSSRPESSAAHTSPPSAAADSAISMDTLLHQFQAGSPRYDTLTGTSSTREALTHRYLVALARFDTSALRQMHITRAEYAYVYFPSSTMMKPPYELPPDVAWLLLTAESNKGIASVMRRFAGQALTFESVRCPGEPLREGPNIVWRDCVVRYRGEGAGVRERPLFAAIIERGGQFKFFSYATPL
jgi:hypothetical protein